MTTQNKVYTVENLAQKLKEAKTVVLADYHGLDVSQLAELRKTIRKAGGEFEVVKNTLLTRAAKESKVEIDPKILKGPTAALWSYKDQLTPLKALMDFVKANQLPKVKFGLLDQVITPIERIKLLASLPTKEELQAKLVGVLKSPTYGLTNALSWNIRKLVLVLKAKGGEVNG